jgi:hypothetical protein
MSALTFFVRPKLFCLACSAPVEQQVQSDPQIREVWCAEPTCRQFLKRALLVDQHLVLIQQPSDMVLDTHGNH